MEALKGWFTAITGIIVLSAIGEGILPSGNMKKYVRILFGIILVIVICRPFISGMAEGSLINTDNYEAYIENKNMDDKERETVLRLYKANMAKQIIASLEGIAENCDIDVSVDVETQNMNEFGKIRDVTVTVGTDDEELYVSDEIEEIISRTYGVPKKNIAVKYTEK